MNCAIRMKHQYNLRFVITNRSYFVIWQMFYATVVYKDMYVKTAIENIP